MSTSMIDDNHEMETAIEENDDEETIFICIITDFYVNRTSK